MTAKAKLISLCRDHGCMLIDSTRFLRLDAPPEKVFGASGLHSVDAPLRGINVELACEELLPQFSRDVIWCRRPNCEVCAKPLTFEEILSLFPGERLA